MLLLWGLPVGIILAIGYYAEDGWIITIGLLLTLCSGTSENCPILEKLEAD